MLVEASEKAGITMSTSQELQSIEKTDGQLRLITTDGKTGNENVHVCNMVVHGLGRVPAIEGLETEKGGVEVRKVAISVNQYMQSVSNPYMRQRRLYSSRASTYSHCKPAGKYCCGQYP
ncbi:MAG: FAD-dependent oxidoreductase [Methanolobus sp.]